MAVRDVQAHVDQRRTDPFARGTHVGPYEIVREIGRGGMGRVLLARDRAAGDRAVAIKVLLGDAAERPVLEARFRREIANLARLRHPGIVTLFAAGSCAGHHFLVMDYLPGRDLREYVVECARLATRERIARITAVMAQVARAVAYAHAQGIVHRDIKPSNIRVAAGSDAAVLLDFGISKRCDDAALTGVEAPGTALYMAPEQLDVRLRASEHLVDVWALGVTLYVALTGEPPFKGDTPLALSHEVVYGEPAPPRRLDARIPHELEAVVLGCMQKDPRARIQSADEVARLLERAHAASAGAPAADASVAAAPVALPRHEATATRHGAVDPREQPTVLEPHEGAERHAPGDVAAARPRGSARQRRRALRIRIALTAAGFVLLVLARGMGLVEARGPRDDPAPRNAAAARPLPTPTLALAFDPRIAAMLAGDEQLARSALLYGAELDVKSRRSLMSALHALAGQRVADALPLLESFVRDNPRCGLTSLARFWIAAGELASGRADEAGAAFAALVADAPRSRFAPRALLLEAAARGARGDEAGRARLLERLAAEYPASAAARDASRPFAAG